MSMTSVVRRRTPGNTPAQIEAAGQAILSKDRRNFLERNVTDTFNKIKVGMIPYQQVTHYNAQLQKNLVDWQLDPVFYQYWANPGSYSTVQAFAQLITNNQANATKAVNNLAIESAVVFAAAGYSAYEAMQAASVAGSSAEGISAATQAANLADSGAISASTQATIEANAAMGGGSSWAGIVSQVKSGVSSAQAIVGEVKGAQAAIQAAKGGAHPALQTQALQAQATAQPAGGSGVLWLGAGLLAAKLVVSVI
jgi:hypothetical protein